MKFSPDTKFVEVLDASGWNREALFLLDGPDFSVMHFKMSVVDLLEGCNDQGDVTLKAFWNYVFNLRPIICGGEHHCGSIPYLSFDCPKAAKNPACFHTVEGLVSGIDKPNEDFSFFEIECLGVLIILGEFLTQEGYPVEGTNIDLQKNLYQEALDIDVINAREIEKKNTVPDHVYGFQRKLFKGFETQYLGPLKQAFTAFWNDQVGPIKTATNLKTKAVIVA